MSAQEKQTTEGAATPLIKALGAEGVFLGFGGLEGLAECQTFWDRQPYTTRLYYGLGGCDYLHRDILRAAVRALKNGRPPIPSHTP